MEACIQLDIRKRPTKRRYIYEELRKQILAGKFPFKSPIPSANDLAQRFGVSYVTMHSAMTDLVRDGLLVRHKGKGSFVAEAAGVNACPMTSRLALVLP